MQKQVLEVCHYLPSSLRQVLEKMALYHLSEIQEIRLRANQPLSVVSNGINYFVTQSGKITVLPEDGYQVRADEVGQVFLRACEDSVYAYEKEIQKGFITLQGGNRMGISGRAVYVGDRIHTIRDISSLSIRIAGEHRGCADPLMSYLISKGQLRSCAVISPPGGGKTTILRDIARQISGRGYRVCLIDERGELAASHKGITPYDLGTLCDVLDGCKKADGMMWALRCLSPSLMVADELGNEREAYMIAEGINGGVATVFSVHAADLEQAMKREVMKVLMGKNCLDVVAVLHSSNNPGAIKQIYDLSHKEDVPSDQVYRCFDAQRHTDWNRIFKKSDVI